MRSKDEAIALEDLLLVQHKLFAIDRIRLAQGPIVTVLKGLTVSRQNELIGTSVFCKEREVHFRSPRISSPAAEAKAHPSPQQGRGPPRGGPFCYPERYPEANLDPSFWGRMTDISIYYQIVKWQVRQATKRPD